MLKPKSTDSSGKESYLAELGCPSAQYKWRPSTSPAQGDQASCQLYLPLHAMLRFKLSSFSTHFDQRQTGLQLLGVGEKPLHLKSLLSYS